MTASTFPTLVPNSISLNHGLPRVDEYEGFGVGPIRFKRNNMVNKQSFTFSYRGLSQTSIELLRNHYEDNYGIAAQFTVPASLFGGLTIVFDDSLFRYTETFTEEHIGQQLYNVSVEIQAVEGLELFFILDGGPVTVPAETSVSRIVFVGTAPFILNANGANASQATLVLNAD